MLSKIIYPILKKKLDIIETTFLITGTPKDVAIDKIYEIISKRRILSVDFGEIYLFEKSST